MKMTLAASLLALSLGSGAALAQDTQMPFGTAEDTEYAELLWGVMSTLKLAGPGMIQATPYEGTDPHGMMLETFYTRATVGGHEGDLIVKRNYAPQGVSADDVLRDPETHLDAYTIMFRREAGYDPDNLDWFWVKYLPDGTLDQTPDGVAMAGRIAKGMDEGCIACHTGAAGADMVFTSDYLAN